MTLESMSESEKDNELPNRNELDSVINSSLANGKKPVRKEHTTDKPSENSLVDEIIERVMGEMASHKVSYKFQAIKEQGGIVYIPHPFETVRKGLKFFFSFKGRACTCEEDIG